jgi:hypothetical protein
MTNEEYLLEVKDMVQRALDDLRPVPLSDEVKHREVRTYVATAAMQGYLASIGVVDGIAPTEADIARYSVDMADALLAALATPSEKK